MCSEEENIFLFACFFLFFLFYSHLNCSVARSSIRSTYLILIFRSGSPLFCRFDNFHFRCFRSHSHSHLAVCVSCHWIGWCRRLWSQFHRLLSLARRLIVIALHSYSYIRNCWYCSSWFAKSNTSRSVWKSVENNSTITINQQEKILIEEKNSNKKKHNSNKIKNSKKFKNEKICGKLCASLLKTWICGRFYGFFLLGETVFDCRPTDIFSPSLTIFFF